MADATEWERVERSAVRKDGARRTVVGVTSNVSGKDFNCCTNLCICVCICECVRVGGGDDFGFGGAYRIEMKREY